MRLVWQTQIKFTSDVVLEAYRHCRTWLARRATAIELPELPIAGAWTSDSSSSSAEVEIAHRNDSSVIDKLALRAVRDIPQQGLRWCTDVGLSNVSTGTLLTIRVRQQLTSGRMIAPSAIQVKAPAFLRFLLLGAPVADLNPTVLDVPSSPELVTLLDLIDTPRRSSLLIAISVDGWTRRPLIDPNAVLDQLFGIATVALIGKEASLAMPRLIQERGAGQDNGRRWGAYNGAVRIYKPGCDFAEDSPFDHPLYLPESVQRPDFLDDLQDWAVAYSTLRPAPPLDVDQIRGDRLKESARLANDADTYKKLLAASEDDAERERSLREAIESRTTAEISRLRWRIQDLEQRNADEQIEGSNEGHSTTIPALNFFRSESGKRPVLDFIDDLPPTDSSVARSAISQLPKILAEGKSRLVEKVKGGSGNSARGSLFEYRVNTKDYWLRFFFARSTTHAEVLVLSSYAKKQNELDPNEIDTAAKCLQKAWDRGWR